MSLLAAVTPCTSSFPVSPLCNVHFDSLDAITQLIVNLIQLALQLAGIAAVVFIIVGGIMYITSAGSPAGVTKAKNTLVGAVVGLIIAILAYAIVGFIAGIF